MTKKCSGIMLITTIMICAILFMLVISILAIKENMRYNASTLEYSDKALIAAKSGTQEALRQLDLYFKDTENTVFSLKNKNIFLDWTSLDSNPDLQYCYKIVNGVMYVGGRYTRLSGNRRNVLAVKYVKANYIMEVLGVAAAKDVEISPDNAVVKSVFSHQTQLPFDPWIAVADGNSKVIIPTPYKSVTSAFPGGITDYFSILKDVENAKEFARRLDFKDGDWRKYADPSVLGGTNQENPEDSELGLSGMKSIGKCGEHDDVLVLDLETQTTRIGGSSQKKEVTLLTKKNLWAVERGRTIYVPNDLILNDAFLLVTGSLVVNGTIRGNGLVVALDNIAFIPANRAYLDIMGFENSFNATEKLVVYAGGSIDVIGRGLNNNGFKLMKMEYYAVPRIATQNITDYANLIKFYDEGKFKTNSESVQIINK